MVQYYYNLRIKPHGPDMLANCMFVHNLYSLNYKKSKTLFKSRTQHNYPYPELVAGITFSQVGVYASDYIIILTSILHAHILCKTKPSDAILICQK
jgi:hypothetical protein